MAGLSFVARQGLGRLVLPACLALAVVLTVGGRLAPRPVVWARLAVADGLLPFFSAVDGPVEWARGAGAALGGAWALQRENARLREENARLRSWQSVALALDAENATLKADLHWIPDPAPSYVSARVVADIGGVYGRAVLLAAGKGSGIKRGEIALDALGLVGRVTEVGDRSARVLLLTDVNSRVPVLLEGSRAHALLVGMGGDLPRLMFWPDGAKPAEGDRVVTSAEAGAFPAGLPVGVVRYAGTVPEVRPFAQLDRLEVVRIFDYGLGGVVPPETVSRSIGQR